MNNLFNKFTNRYFKVLENSKALALNDKKNRIEPEHILMSLAYVRGTVALEVLARAGFKNNILRPIRQAQGEQAQDNLSENKLEIPFSEATKQIIESSINCAVNFEHAYVGTEHLLFALLNFKDEKIDKVFLKNKINRQDALRQIEVILKTSNSFKIIQELPEKIAAKFTLDENINEIIASADNEILSEVFNDFDMAFKKEELPELKSKEFKKVNKKSLLDVFAINLTDERIQAKIDPVIGREKEINRIIQILIRRSKNNPVLLGDPGVGKTAIIEGLAKKILLGEVPEVLMNKKIYSLEMNNLVAGAIMRGEFEMRLKSVIEEVAKNPNIILFIDELHNIVGAGSAPGSMDAANILKPALARGELRCIGATTFEEYKKHIEDDSALERRFQAIKIEEPSEEQAIEILKGIRKNFEEHHLVKISDEAIEFSVKLSEKYLPEKFLPDKAIDLIDEACARKKIDVLDQNENFRQKRLIENKLEDLEKKKSSDVLHEKYSDALKIKDQQLRLLENLKNLEDKIQNEKIEFKDKIIGKDVALIVNEMTGVPMEKLLSAKENILSLKKNLNKRIIGQERVVEILFEHLKRAIVGLEKNNSPIGSFMFFGPSGTGKTETAKVLAEEFFGGKKSLIRFDMSEFSESFNISRLIGSPAGYVGYKEGGRLTEAVRRRPYSVILFDEVEKAHPKVFSLFLQILDEGYLTDATGKQIDFSNTIIIMTSNFAVDEFNSTSLGFGDDAISNSADEKKFEVCKKKIEDRAKKQFPLELLNRLSEIIVFEPLALKSVEKIVSLKMKDLKNKLFEIKKIKIEYAKNVIKKIAEQSYSPESGARKIDLIIKNEIENKIISLLLSTQGKNIKELEINLIKNELSIKIKK